MSHPVDIPELAHSLEAEVSVLGAVLLDPGLINSLAPLLAPEAFSRDGHGAIYRAMRALYDRCEPIDLVTLAGEIQRTYDLALVGGYEYLSALLGAVPSAANALHYARIIREAHACRELQIAASAWVRGVHTIDEVAEDLEAHAVRLRTSRQDSRRKPRTANEMARALADRIDEACRADSNDVSVRGVPWGLRVLDETYGPMRQGRVTYIGARPGVGKTSLLFQVATHTAREVGPVAVFSLEMGGIDAWERIVAQEAGVAADTFRAPNSPQGSDMISRVFGAGGTPGVLAGLSKLPLVLDEDDTHSIASLRAATKAIAKERGPLAAVFIDYVQKVRVEGLGKDAPDEKRIAAVSTGLVGLAKELSVPVCAAVAMNRASEAGAGTENRKPKLSDLRGSGMLESDADMVLLLHRATHPDASREAREQCEVIVAKHRFGATESVFLHYEGRATRFREMAQPSSTLATREHDGGHDWP